MAAFSDLPGAQIEWFISHVEEVSLCAGEIFVRQGDPADWMFVFLKGHFQWTGEFGGDTVSLPARAGEISGVYPFSRMKKFTVTGRAITDGNLIRFPAALLPQLTQKMPELTTRLVAMMSDRIREGTRIEQQRDRLLSLGKLSAGLAHELNNPASAAKRASDQIRGLLATIRTSNSELWRRSVDEKDKLAIEEAEASLLQPAAAELDGSALIELEDRLDALLRNYGHADSWKLSPALAKCNMSPVALTSLLQTLDPNTARAALERIAASAEVSSLVRAIESSTGRILNLVRTIKEYTYLDQAPVQNVDVVQSLEITLSALVHILQPGIKVQRSYEPVPLLHNIAGPQLNQVWSNLIENAVEAMAGQGELRVRIFREDHYVVGDIGDSGPGIPPEIMPYIFDPFFTTKGVGEGAGLGLNTVQTIVRKLGGNIRVDTAGDGTHFQVRIPCNSR